MDALFPIVGERFAQVNPKAGRRPLRDADGWELVAATGLWVRRNVSVRPYIDCVARSIADKLFKPSLVRNPTQILSRDSCFEPSRSTGLDPGSNPGRQQKGTHNRHSGEDCYADGDQGSPRWVDQRLTNRVRVRAQYFNSGAQRDGYEPTQGPARNGPSKSFLRSRCRLAAGLSPNFPKLIPQSSRGGANRIFVLTKKPTLVSRYSVPSAA